MVVHHPQPVAHLPVPSCVTNARRRSRARWLLGAGLVVLLAFWFVSRWWTFFLGVPNGPFGAFHAGTIMVGYGRPNGWYNGVRRWNPRVWNWLPRGGVNDGSVQVYAFVPIWMVAVPLGGAIIWSWRREAALPGDPCSRCGYDRSGLTAGSVCPECGG